METVNIVWMGIGIFIMLCISYFYYRKYLRVDSKQFVPNDEYKPEPIKYECILFYTSWCPHCKKTIKEWDDYKQKNQNDNATFTSVDCDKHADKANFYEIDSYPTIIMLVKDKKYIFDSNFSKESMDKFVNTILKL
jgi:thiol-disulfide isomerase/thioredoxin